MPESWGTNVITFFITPYDLCNSLYQKRPLFVLGMDGFLGDKTYEEKGEKKKLKWTKKEKKIARGGKCSFLWETMNGKADVEIRWPLFPHIFFLTFYFSLLVSSAYGGKASWQMGEISGGEIVGQNQKGEIVFY